MTSLVRQNKSYFLPFLVIFITGLIFALLIEKGDLLLWMGARHTDFFNLFFYYATQLGEENPYYLAIAVLAFIKYRYALLVILGGIVNPLLSATLKGYFQHPRPYTYYEQLRQLDQLGFIDYFNVPEGFNSFPSGHTISAFTLYTLLALMTKLGWAKSVFLVLAVLVALSRIYLQVHFLQDVVFGAVIGTVLATLLFWCQKKWYANRLNGSLRALVRRRQNA